MSGWFDEQLRERIKADDEIFSDAFASISEVIIAKGVLSQIDENERANAKDALIEILRYYDVSKTEIEDSSDSWDTSIDSVLKPFGIMKRSVELRGAWYKDAVGAFLCKTRDGQVVALIPHGYMGYYYHDRITKKTVHVTKKTAQTLQTEASCFYRPLPRRTLEMKDLFTFMAKSLSFSDYFKICLITVMVGIISLITPWITKYVYSQVVYMRSVESLNAVLIMLIAVSIATTLLSMAKQLMLSRVKIKTDTTVRAASMMRLISLPTDFFRRYASGELSQRVQYINVLCTTLADGILSTGLTALVSLIFVGQIFSFAPELVWPAAIAVLAMLLLSIFTMIVQMNVTRMKLEYKAKESGVLYAFLTGIQKIKLSGSEKRAFAKWVEKYKKNASLVYDAPMFLKLNSVFTLAITIVSTILIYEQAVASNVGVDAYMAFSAAYAVLSAAFLALSQAAVSASSIKPVFTIIKPILQTAPETVSGKKQVAKLMGGIDLTNVSFRYGEDMPLVLNDLSLHIKAGQYVAIVGKSGCGKSTLMRLLLGFETPLRGAIYFDERDMQNLDIRSLRGHIGTVMQNSKLFAGSIFANIAISSPNLTLDEAWHAAELAGIAEDIRQMPMGMNTLVAEGSGCGVSGGQRQRIVIARALAQKPEIILFDEATSALDNITMKIVTDTLDALKCTRIVIAHRLSTIKHCDRILMLEDGKIIEDGNYDELMAQNGRFTQLMRRQQVMLDE